MKRSMILSVCLFVIGTLVSFAQGSKTLSAGLKVGVPNLVTLSGEVHLPFLSNIAVYADYSDIKLNAEDLQLDNANGNANLGYFEYGANLYLGKRPGRGVYLGAGIANFNADLELTDIEIDDGAQTGNATTNVKFNTTNFKLGIKTGGFIYMRMEVGYAMGDLPTAVTINATTSDNSYSETIVEEFNYEEMQVPGLSEKGMPLFNLGLGLSF